jgi:hypothetical protein
MKRIMYQNTAQVEAKKGIHQEISAIIFVVELTAAAELTAATAAA